jgi:hypothetical protein
MTIRLSAVLLSTLFVVPVLSAVPVWVGEITFDTPMILDASLTDPWGLTAADLDGDLDLDLLAASVGQVVWYKNTDGMGTFSSKLPVASGALVGQARTVCAADFDGDLDLDVLVGSPSNNEIYWYKNTDGLGTFGPALLVTTALVPYAAHAADVDGDGDMDVISTALGDNTIGWNENLDARGTFGPRQIITSVVNQAVSITTADIDGDTDLDLLSASIVDNTIAWYENLDGDGTFGPQQVITTLAKQAIMVAAGDIDGDLDIDVLSASQEDDEISWYENLDGAGTFGPQIIINMVINGASSALPVDMDFDGDLDVLTSGQNDDSVSWFENMDGAGTFSAEKSITTAADSPKCAIAADFNGDGDLDVVISSYKDDKIRYVVNYLDMWIKLGSALAGSSGLPKLEGTGFIVPGEIVSLNLEKAKPLATVAMIIGLGELYLPLKGGTIVPTPDVFLFGTTNTAGKLNFPGPWPASLPGGFTFFMQEWIVDDAGPQGYAASNGLRGMADG